MKERIEIRCCSEPVSWAAWTHNAIWVLFMRLATGLGLTIRHWLLNGYWRAAERGHTDAQYNLGFMYLRGEGLQSDQIEGLQWLRRAADQGDEQTAPKVGHLVVISRG